jgi:hypothetical protein
MSFEQTDLLSEPDGEVPETFDRPHRIRRRPPTGQLIVASVPLPLSGRDRIAWRIASALLCLDVCRGRSATVEQLHVLSWAVRDQHNEDALVAAWEHRAGADRLLRAWDPGLDDTLKLARASGLVSQRPKYCPQSSAARSRMLARASSAVSSASGYLSVVRRLPCPSRCRTTWRSVPPASSQEACACRRSCMRTQISRSAAFRAGNQTLVRNRLLGRCPSVSTDRARRGVVLAGSPPVGGDPRPVGRGPAPDVSRPHVIVVNKAGPDHGTGRSPIGY